MPKTITRPGNWDHDLRRQLKREHGPGWTLVEQSGKVKLTRRYEDGARASVTLDIPWEAGNSTAIANEVAVIKARMDEHGIGLRDAHERGNTVQGTITANGVKAGAVSWPAVAEAFLQSRSDRRATTLRDLNTRIGNALQTLSSKPAPTDGASLMKLYAQQHFANCPAGGMGRKRHLGDVAAFLIYAVDRCGAPGRCMPITGDPLDDLIGTADNTDESLTPPVKPEQLGGLLDQLLADERQDLWLAVALVGCFGLRPAELAALTVDDGRLYVGGQVKRNRRTMKSAKAARLVLPLEIPGRDDGARALKLYASSLVKLPKAIRTAIDSGEFKKVGDAFRQLLDRYPLWVSMVAATPGLTPYSLRHGFAWRAHKAYARPLSVRDAAALMGHNPNTHHRHSGRWTDEQGLLDAVAGLTAAPASGVPATA